VDWSQLAFDPGQGYNHVASFHWPSNLLLLQLLLPMQLLLLGVGTHGSARGEGGGAGA